jgi:hypothetical protein
MQTKNEDFLSYDDATKKQRAAVVDMAESTFYHSIRAEQDKDWIQNTSAKVDQSKPEDVVVLIRYLQSETAKQLEYTVQAVRHICKTHGMSALLPTRLKLILINKQRSTPSVRAWIRSQQEIENAERAKTYVEPEVEYEEPDNEQIEREAEGNAWAAKWQIATDEEIDAEVTRFGLTC